MRHLTALRPVLAALLTGVLLASAQGPAVARKVDQVHPVPASGKYVVRGHGYGHGIGMSQHGAQGAALAGLTHERILAFYYPGTELGTAGGKIRVLVSADTTPDVVVRAKKGLFVRDLGAGTNLVLPDNGAAQWRIVPDAQRRSTVQFLRDGVWRKWRAKGPGTLQGDGQFRAQGPLDLVTPSGVRRYRGVLRSASPTAGSADRDTVNVVSLDNFVKGVVPREMPVSWEPEAVQTQAVAARTYAVNDRDRNRTRHYQTCDTVSCQVYGGKGDEHPLGNAAVRATEGQIVTYEGAPAFTQFSSSSGGWSANGSTPYLKAHEDPYDDWSGNANHDWTTTLTAARIQQAYPAIGKLQRIRITGREGYGEWQGRVTTMVLEGSKARRTLTGPEFRFTFGLRSAWFTFGG